MSPIKAGRQFKLPSLFLGMMLVTVATATAFDDYFFVARLPDDVENQKEVHDIVTKLGKVRELIPRMDRLRKQLGSLWPHEVEDMFGTPVEREEGAYAVPSFELRYFPIRNLPKWKEGKKSHVTRHYRISNFGLLLVYYHPTGRSRRMVFLFRTDDAFVPVKSVDDVPARLAWDTDKLALLEAWFKKHAKRTVALPWRTIKNKEVRKLVEKLESSDERERSSAESEFGMLVLTSRKATAQAVPSLVLHVQQERDTLIKDNILRLLGDIGDGRAVPILKKYPFPGIESLGKIAGDGLDAQAQEAALVALLELAKADDGRVRSYAVTYLARTTFSWTKGEREHDPRVKEALKVAASDPDPAVRRSAPESIVRAFKKKGVPLLKPMLKDRDVVVAVRAAFQLANLGDKTGLPTMKKHMFDQTFDRTERFHCLQSLEHVDGEDVISLIKRWVSESRIEVYSGKRLLEKKGIREDPVPKWKVVRPEKEEQE